MEDQLIVKRMYYFTNVLDKLCQLQGSDSIAFDDMWWMKQIIINVEVSVWLWHGVRTIINTQIPPESSDPKFLPYFPEMSLQSQGLWRWANTKCNIFLKPFMMRSSRWWSEQTFPSMRYISSAERCSKSNEWDRDFNILSFTFSVFQILSMRDKFSM